MEINEGIKKVHKLYEMSKDIFLTDTDLQELSSAIEDEEELRFFNEIYEYYMRKSQAESIKRGVF